MFPLICVWINGWVNNREAGDLRRYRAHYDVIVMNGDETLRELTCIYGDCGLPVEKSPLLKLDESTARRHLKLPRVPIQWILTPHPGQQKVTVMVMNDRLPPLLFNVNRSSQSWDMAISQFENENRWSRPCVWSKVRFPLLAQQPIDLFPFRFTSIGSAIPEIQLFKKLTLNTQGQSNERGKTIGYTWGLVFNR